MRAMRRLMRQVAHLLAFNYFRPPVWEPELTPASRTYWLTKLGKGGYHQ